MAKQQASEGKKQPKKQPAAAAEAPVERERIQFRALLLSNPNYFGNLKESPFKPAAKIQANTSYEELGCVGLQPQFNRLEAVVYIKRTSGYGGGVCSDGTPEYVRFYLSFDGGATWDDQGLTSFTAYDIATDGRGQQRLEYAVSLRVQPPKKFCFRDNGARVRAILSWNVPPPPNDPGFTPVWGNVREADVQVDPLKLFAIEDLFKALDVALPEDLPLSLDVTQAVAAKPKTLGAVELQKQYQDEQVEPHRFAFAELQQLISQPAKQAAFMAPGFKGILPDLNIDLGDLIGKLFPTDGNTSYEELTCIGLNPDQDALVGVIHVKKPSGYSGGPCTAGSREYVTFWADFDDNGTFETCLGTTSVNVHDIQNIPRGGLAYAVFLPVDLSRYRRPCQEGPRLVRIRAILSWQVAPPCFNPNYVPVWGNREETLIHIKPGRQSVPGTHVPIIQTVGSMDVGDIDPLTGLADGPAALAGFTADDSPFGGEVILTGHLANPSDISNGAARLKYRVEVSGNGGATWQALTNSFNLALDQLLNGVWSDLPTVNQHVDGDGWYEYQEDLTGGPGNAQIFPVGNVLARWQTAGLTGLWRIRILAKDPANPGPVWISNTVTVRIDSEAPGAGLTITTGGGACADFTIGDVISGTYTVSDEHFGSLTLSVQPPNGGAFTNPAPYPGAGQMPLTRAYGPVPPGVPATGEAGTWSLDTTGMPRCGYVVWLHARDRTIVNSGFVGRTAQAVVGLCLRSPDEA